MMNLILHLQILILLAGAPSPVNSSEFENPLEIWTQGVTNGCSETKPPFQLVGELQMEGNVPGIEFQIKNTSNEALRFFPERMPWGNTHSIRLVGIRADGHILRNTYPLDNPAPANVMELEPGEVIRGRYSLASGTVDITETDREQDIVVLWYYCWRFLDGAVGSGLVSGVVVIPALR